MEVEEPQILEEIGNKKVRRRKKQLYSSILQQMEFYFSDANLRKDRFIGKLIKTNPYVDLSVFLNFNKITALTNKVEDIATALEKSQMLQLSEDNLKVCRITPIHDKLNEDECTIYVERLPEDTQHDWLKEIFSTFGPIDYVSLPKYKHNKRHKGFAFIEFSEPESALKAITYFESIGCKLPTKMSPNQLVSIVTFESENGRTDDINGAEQNMNTEEVTEEKVSLEKSEKESPDEAQENQIEDVPVVENEDLSENKNVKTNKRKLSVENEEAEVKKSKIEDKNVDGREEDSTDVQEEDVDKKKRKRKKTKKNVNDFKQIGLQVLAKKEWKQLRNKYLNMQRFKMKSLKDHLYRNRYQGNNYQEDNTKSDRKNKKKDQEEQKVEEESEPRFKYTPGCIISFKLPEECSDVKKFKTDVRSKSGVEFVDVQPGKNSGFIRFMDGKSTQSFYESAFIESMSILEGDEEKQYWDIITVDRETKLKKNNKKMRGREKLLKKAEQELGKHIRFE